MRLDCTYISGFLFAKLDVALELVDDNASSKVLGKDGVG